MDDENILQRMENTLVRISNRLISLERKVDAILYEDEEEEGAPPPVRNDSSTDVKRFGQKMPYNRLDGPEQLERFRKFLDYIRMNESKFTPQQYKFAAYANKSFEDIRISDNSRRILGEAWSRHYGSEWKFTFIRGFMFKLNNDIEWEWADGFTG